jgi:phage/plasmid-like protein (TIGR03299 family)
MAHEISIRANGHAEMAFVGTTPWHGLGQRVTEGAPLEVWAQQAGMDWKALEAPVTFQRADDQGTGTVADKKVLYRSDTGAPLSVVGDGYHVVQPREVLEFFRDLTEANEWHIHTAGVLRGGRKLWALARNHTEGEVQPGDKVRGNLLLATSLDGSMKTIAAMTAVRVVCANTLRLALADTKDMHATSHRSEFDAGAAKRAIGVARESFATFMEQARKMADTPVHIEEARAILRELFGKPVILKAAPAKVSGGSIDGSDFAQLLARPATLAGEERTREQRSVARALELFNGEARGSEHASAHGTRWGLFNAVTEHIDHERGRTSDNRLDAAWFGDGHDVKAQALKLLTA